MAVVVQKTDFFDETEKAHTKAIKEIQLLVSTLNLNPIKKPD
jgi:hypothetical protein